ncbi:hypothetical protein LSTR_LSTR007615 [Laodelphax striatellus]|uniref:Uncharacterized protein n=1 Tax=Laodelphax striatellus TaxID=195883 RepID=A0A482WIV5_LAOST|nr:hypothetical protein LSTR_LSTR007615 [Laodelphax striatellus]
MWFFFPPQQPYKIRIYRESAVGDGRGWGGAIESVLVDGTMLFSCVQPFSVKPKLVLVGSQHPPPAPPTKHKHTYTYASAHTQHTNTHT